MSEQHLQSGEELEDETEISEEGSEYSSEEEDGEEASEAEDEDDDDDSGSDTSLDTVTRKRNRKIIFNLTGTKYEVIKQVGKKYGWKITRDDETDWDVCWVDSAVLPERLSRMKMYQKINHFPGMYAVARKDFLGRNLGRMRKQFPDEYKFYPRTWLLPTEYSDFRNQFNKKKAKTFIVKPEASCQGRGIFLTRSCESIPIGEHFVAQRYIHKPYLIDDLKFDLRLYVLVAGCDPLRLFIHEEGLARFATEEYCPPLNSNLNDVCMHLTNYAINKNSDKFVFNEDEDDDDTGHKRSLYSVWRYLEDEGEDVEKLKEEINQIIIKTMICIQPSLAHTYKSCQPNDPTNSMCFEVLGFDILLDHKLKPWLIEINHTPSFATDTPLDHSIKKAVVRDSLNLMDVNPKYKRIWKAKKQEELEKRVLSGKSTVVKGEERAEHFSEMAKKRDQYEAENLRGFTKIFPVENAAEEYDHLLEGARQIWDELTGTNKKLKKIEEMKNAKAGQGTFGAAPKKPASVSITGGIQLQGSARGSQLGEKLVKPLANERVVARNKPQDTDQSTAVVSESPVELSSSVGTSSSFSAAGSSVSGSSGAASLSSRGTTAVKQQSFGALTKISTTSAYVTKVASINNSKTTSPTMKAERRERPMFNTFKQPRENATEEQSLGSESTRDPISKSCTINEYKTEDLSNSSKTIERTETYNSARRRSLNTPSIARRPRDPQSMNSPSAKISAENELRNSNSMKNYNFVGAETRVHHPTTRRTVHERPQAELDRNHEFRIATRNKGHEFHTKSHSETRDAYPLKVQTTHGQDHDLRNSFQMKATEGAAGRYSSKYSTPGSKYQAVSFSNGHYSSAGTGTMQRRSGSSQHQHETTIRQSGNVRVPIGQYGRHHHQDSGSGGSSLPTNASNPSSSTINSGSATVAGANVAGGSGSKALGRAGYSTLKMNHGLDLPKVLKKGDGYNHHHRRDEFGYTSSNNGKFIQTRVMEFSPHNGLTTHQKQGFTGGHHHHHASGGGISSMPSGSKLTQSLLAAHNREITKGYVGAGIGATSHTTHVGGGGGGAGGGNYMHQHHSAAATIKKRQVGRY